MSDDDGDDLAAPHRKTAAEPPDDSVVSAKLDEINALISPLGAVATALGADAVAVMGDGRVVGASVLVRLPLDATVEFRQEIAGLITNQVRGIARVLMDIPI